MSILSRFHGYFLIVQIFFVYLTFFQTPAFSSEFFVSPGGDEKSSGIAPALPTSTMSALKRVNSGDKIIFLDGIYNSPLVLSRSGTTLAPIILQAKVGATPVFRGSPGNQSDGILAAADISNYVIDGLWFEGWAQAGIGLSWNHHVDGITILNCVADFNGIAGIGLYFASHVTIKNNIASRNGYGPNSWSSNFDIYGIRGTNNQIVGNVAFHGVDTSSHHSDGNGFILDLTIDQGSALFKNNIGFFNGGSCITVADSGGAQLIGNTCFANAQHGSDFLDEILVGNTCRAGVVGKVPVNSRPYTFVGLELHHNLVEPTNPSKKGIVPFYSNCGGQQTYIDDGNTIRYLPADAINAMNPLPPGTDSATLPLSFDFKCIKKEMDPNKIKYSFWKFAPDFGYIHRIGGVARCFKSQPPNSLVRH